MYKSLRSSTQTRSPRLQRAANAKRHHELKRLRVHTLNQKRTMVRLFAPVACNQAVKSRAPHSLHHAQSPRFTQMPPAQASMLARGKALFICSSKQAPNPSVERTSNGGAHWRAPSRSVAPLAAAHLKR